MPHFLQVISSRRELVLMLIQRNLKIRYKGSVLGFFWSLLTPGVMILIYAVFARILKFNDGNPHYLQFLVCGIIVWQFISGTLGDSLHAIAGNANLVKKVAFPRLILPLSTVLANAVNFLLTFAVLLLYLLLSGAFDPARIYLLVPAFLLHLTLALGISFLVATTNVFFRDTEHIVGVGILAWFFLSPIIYSLALQLNMFPGKAAICVFLNPVTGILALYRAALMGQPIIPAGFCLNSMAAIGLSAVGCLAALAIGLAALRMGDRHFGDVL